MTDIERVKLHRLRTGVAGLDQILGGGVPEYSFTLVAGPPGVGKTTLVHQFVFANATDARPALYFTVVGEPPLKMLRYQQQLAFFDPALLDHAIRFVDLSAETLAGDLEGVLAAIVRHVKNANPAFVVVDSFRTIVKAHLQQENTGGLLAVQAFLQRLALHLATWQTTSFLVGEYSEGEMEANPVFTIADSILWLGQTRANNSVVRKLEVVKMRGCATVPGQHTFRITGAGIQVFPRTSSPAAILRAHRGLERCATGVVGLDALLSGGLPRGDATLVGGPSGTGKTAFASQFIAAGLAIGEPGVVAVYEEQPGDYLDRAKSMGIDLEAALAADQLRLVYARPPDLSADEVLHEITVAVEAIGAKRLVIDSLNGVELALAAGYGEDFPASLYRLIGHLTAAGISTMLTIEVVEAFDQLTFSPHSISFLAQNIISLRYVEIEGRLQKMLAVIKMRRSAHSPLLHSYDITSKGITLREPLISYRGLLRGVAEPRREGPAPSGLTAIEEGVLRALIAAGEGTTAMLAAATGLGEEQVQHAVGRLLDLQQVIRLEDETARGFRPADRIPTH